MVATPLSIFSTIHARHEENQIIINKTPIFIELPPISKL